MKRSTFLTSHEVSEGLSRLAAREGLSVSAFAVRELAETALRAGNARCWANLRISTRRRRWGGWAQLGLRRFAAVGLLAGIWELHDNLTAHDATYVALAEALGCELVTADAPTRRCPRTNLRDQGNPTLRWPAGAPAARADVVTPGRYELASRDRASTSDQRQLAVQGLELLERAAAGVGAETTAAASRGKRRATLGIGQHARHGGTPVVPQLDCQLKAGLDDQRS